MKIKTVILLLSISVMLCACTNKGVEPMPITEEPSIELETLIEEEIESIEEATETETIEVIEETTEVIEESTEEIEAVEESAEEAIEEIESQNEVTVVEEAVPEPVPATPSAEQQAMIDILLQHSGGYLQPGTDVPLHEISGTIDASNVVMH